MLTYKKYYEAKCESVAKFNGAVPPKLHPDEAVRVCFAQRGADRDATSTHQWEKKPCSANLELIKQDVIELLGIIEEYEAQHGS